jgi:hypothetical protein
MHKNGQILLSGELAALYLIKIVSENIRPQMLNILEITFQSTGDLVVSG